MHSRPFALAEGSSPCEIRGRTLLETVIVIAIIGAIAAVASPTLTSADRQKLDLAAHEFVTAVRFARQEAVRSGIPHGITTNVGGDQYRVFRLDLDTVPATLVYDVYHPVAKQIYTTNLNSGLTRGVTLDQIQLTFAAPCNNTSGFAFGPSGNPICTDPLTSPVATAQTTFAQRGLGRVVSVSPMNGRVTAQ